METKRVKILGIETFVTLTGQGRPVLFLHGWEASHESAGPIREQLANDPVQVIAPDLPGFGESADPPEPWSVDDYADFVDAFVSELNLNDVLLVGHSFGGRISIKLASRHLAWISHLYLCAAAGICQAKYWKRTIGIFLAETGKVIFSLPVLSYFKKAARHVLYKILRVHDYENAKGVNRQTMIKVINEGLTPLLELIDVPVDLFWGTDDGMTPLKHGKIMNKKIAHSNLHVYANVRHAVHRDKAKEIAEAIRQAL